MMIQLMNDQLKLFFYVTQPNPHHLKFSFVSSETLERLQQVARNFN